MRAITVTFPWNGKTEAMIDILGEHEIGFTLDKDGLTVELAEGTTEAECRSMMADAMERRKAPRKTRRQS
jgi:hypothetical protein